MQAAVVNVLGQAPKYQSFLDPVAGDGEEVIQVHAAGLHPIVKARRQRHALLGARAGPLDSRCRRSGNSKRWKPGFLWIFTRVRLVPWRSGRYRRSMCVPLPDGINDVQAAAIANPGCQHGSQ